MNFNINEDNTMEYLGWKQINPEMLPPLRTKARKNMKLFTKNGFIAYQRSYYLVVKGKVPFVVAKDIFDQYSDLEIRFCGGANDEPTIDRCCHDDLIEYTESLNIEIDGFEGFSKKYDSKKAQLIKDDADGFYCPEYHIDKLQGIKAFTDVITQNNVINNFLV